MTPALARRLKGYTYVEVMVALLIFAVALVPAIESMNNSLGAMRQTGGARDVKDKDGVLLYQVTDEQAVINKMETLLANNTPAALSANPSGKDNHHLTLSDPDVQGSTAPRALVYTSWYVPEAADPANRFVTVSSSRLLWLRVSIENGQATATTLVYVPTP